MLPMVAFTLWIVASLALGFAETLTEGISLMPFAAGALLAGVVTVFGVGFLVQAACFVGAAVAVAALFGFRHGGAGGGGDWSGGGGGQSTGWVPPTATYASAPQEQPVEGAGELVGQVAIVTERVFNAGSRGAVHLGGDVWQARAQNDGATFEIGALVRVAEIRGTTALVSEM